MLISLYIFSKESEISQNETNPAQLEKLKDEYRTIIERLNKLMEEGKLSDLDRTTLLETVVLLGREFSRDVEYAYLDYEPRKNVQFKGGCYLFGN